MDDILYSIKRKEEMSMIFEDVKKPEAYKGKRIKRGLFKSENGLIYNADINRSYNIMKKVVGKTIHKMVDPIAVMFTPLIKTF